MAKQPRVWTGTQWDTLAVTLPDLSNYSTTTQMNTAIGANAGLNLITSATIGSAVASVTVNNVFTDTYSNYKIIVDGITGSTTSNLTMTLDGINSVYESSQIYGDTRSGTTVTNIPSNSGQSVWTIGTSAISSSSTENTCFQIDLYNLRTNGYRKYYNGWVSTYGAVTRQTLTFGASTTTAKVSYFTIAPSTGTITGGTIRVYGYRNS